MAAPQRYHRLARIMEEDKNFAIFRKFDEVNITQLMALQAEIVELQYRFQLKAEQDDKNGHIHSGSFHALRHSVPTRRDKEAHNDGNDQLSLLNALRTRITEYNTLLLQALTGNEVAELSKLPTPQKSQLDALQDWLTDPKGGDNFTAKMGGTELYTWKPTDVTKYVSLRQPAEDSDPFTEFIMGVMARIYHRIFSQKFMTGRVVDLESGLTSYSDSKLIKASNLIAVMVSSALPVLTIFVLNTLTSTTLRLGLTVLFTVVFAVVLEIFTSAKRIEIFAATATFAAVEVVFIGSALKSD
ncbi:uncharacterized protein FIESC28_07672 [Fusarium coffeatum]|uniref:DUF6594 domain-containing protein n=1 Tax=Fusarium coffeatum TaxID=231269 RepID=A0A366RDM1_9HYPO|nr:uncharacterized protein FIESC28_07672 [Fusarium coffeatum]RBR14436.1 hypothetical protein FIESC28_07672 [Fusarium coffeatum]